jgi:hypothetical protein
MQKNKTNRDVIATCTVMLVGKVCSITHNTTLLKNTRSRLKAILLGTFLEATYVMFDVLTQGDSLGGGP